MADLNAIETTLYTAVRTLASDASPAGPFRFVGRWTGQVREQGGMVTLQKEIAGKATALLLQWDRETATESFEGLEGAGDIESRGELRILAWVVATDTRGVTELVKGTTNVTGGMALVDAVVNALNGRQVLSASAQQLYRNTCLRYRGHEVLPLSDGASHLVARVTFVVLRSVATVTPADISHDLDELRGDLNNIQPPTPAPNTPENPFGQIDADT